MNRPRVSKLLSVVCGCGLPMIELWSGVAATSARALVRHIWLLGILPWCVEAKNFRSNLPRSDVGHGWRSPAESMCRLCSAVGQRTYELDLAALPVDRCGTAKNFHSTRIHSAQKF